MAEFESEWKQMQVFIPQVAGWPKMGKNLALPDRESTTTRDDGSYIYNHGTEKCLFSNTQEFYSDILVT